MAAQGFGFFSRLASVRNFDISSIHQRNVPPSPSLSKKLRARALCQNGIAYSSPSFRTFPEKQAIMTEQAVQIKGPIVQLLFLVYNICEFLYGNLTSVKGAAPMCKVSRAIGCQYVLVLICFVCPCCSMLLPSSLFHSGLAVGSTIHSSFLLFHDLLSTDTASLSLPISLDRPQIGSPISSSLRKLKPDLGEWSKTEHGRDKGRRSTNFIHSII